MGEKFPEFEPYEWREDSFDVYTETYIRYVIFMPEAWFDLDNEEEWEENWEEYEAEMVEI